MAIETEKQKYKSKISLDDFDGPYVPARAAMAYTGVSVNTLHKWAELDKIESYRTPTGQILYDKHSLRTIVDGRNDDTKKVSKKSYVYARVSSKHQLEDLQRQIDLLQAYAPRAIVVKDVASGVDFKRKGLQTILECAMRRELETVVVAHKDRLCRFGFELVEWIITSNGGNLVLLDEENKVHTTTEQELAEDLLSIVHVYSCKQMGKRRYRARDQKGDKNKVVSDKATEEPVKAMDGGVSLCLE